MNGQRAAEAGAVVVLGQVDAEGDASRMLKRTIEQVQAGDSSEELPDTPMARGLRSIAKRVLLPG